MKVFCIPEPQGYWGIIVPLLVFAICGLTLWFDHRHSSLSHSERNSGWAVCICLFISFALVFFFLDRTDTNNKLEELFNSPLTFLTIVIGLAAYTSTILTKLREAITTRTSELDLEKALKGETQDEKAGKRQRNKKKLDEDLILGTHKNNYAWLIWADRLLVVIGVLLMITIVLWTAGVQCTYNQWLILSLLLTLVLYFTVLHIRQWNRSIYKLKDQTDLP